MSKDSPMAALRAEIGRVIVGQEGLVTRLLVALLCDGHCLVEGVPGLAKSLTVSTLGGLSRRRLRPTPVHARPLASRPDRLRDLQRRRVEVRGPQRADVHQHPARRRDQPRARQGSVRPARGDAGATSLDRRPDLPAPPPPSSSWPRRIPSSRKGHTRCPRPSSTASCSTSMSTNPGELDEREVLDRTLTGNMGAVDPVMHVDDVLAARARVGEVRMEPRLRDYGRPTRPRHPLPRSAGARAFRLRRIRRLAARHDRPSPSAPAPSLGSRAADYATPDDVKAMALDALRHRIVLSYEAEADEVTADDVITRLLTALPMPLGLSCPACNAYEICASGSLPPLPEAEATTPSLDDVRRQVRHIEIRAPPRPARRPRQRIPHRISRTRPGVRRASALQPRRRRPLDRLEGHRSPAHAGQSDATSRSASRPC